MKAMAATIPPLGIVKGGAAPFVLEAGWEDVEVGDFDDTVDWGEDVVDPPVTVPAFLQEIDEGTL